MTDEETEAQSIGWLPKVPEGGGKPMALERLPWGPRVPVGRALLLTAHTSSCEPLSGALDPSELGFAMPPLPPHRVV